MRTAAISLAIVFITLSAIGQQFLGDRSRVVKADSIQVSHTRVGSDTYGTASSTAYTLNAIAFRTWNSNTTDDWSGGRYITGGAIPEFVSTPVLPEGAVVTRIELDACDNSFAGQVQLFLDVCDSPQTGLGCAFGGSIGTGI